MINFPFAENTPKSAENFFVEVWPRALHSQAVFIHGNLASRRWWYPTLAEWKCQEIAGKASAFLFDFPGCGRSPQFLGSDPISFLDWAALFNKKIQNLTTGPVHLVGHSTGGLVAALMASLNPELFNKIVLLDPVSPLGLEASAERSRLFEKLKLGQDQVRWALQKAVLHHAHLDPKYFEELIDDAWVAGQKIASQIFESLTDVNFTQNVKVIPNKVLILQGEKDEVVSLAGVQLYLQLLQNAQLLILPGIGHSAQIESTSFFAKILREFFGDTTR